MCSGSPLNLLDASPEVWQLVESETWRKGSQVLQGWSVGDVRKKCFGFIDLKLDLTAVGWPASAGYKIDMDICVIFSTF